jgi:hypothetical protein
MLGISDNRKYTLGDSLAVVQQCCCHICVRSQVGHVRGDASLLSHAPKYVGVTTRLHFLLQNQGTATEHTVYCTCELDHS